MARKVIDKGWSAPLFSGLLDRSFAAGHGPTGSRWQYWRGVFRLTSSVKLGTKKLTADLIVGLALRALGAACSFVFAWLIARYFGARVVGLYQIGYTTATLLATVAVLSMDIVLVRKVTPLIATEQLEEASATFRSTRRFTFTLGIALACLGASLAFPFATFVMDEPELGPYIALLSPVVLLLPLLRIQNAFLRSLGKVIVPQSLEGVLYVSIAIVGLFAVAILASEPQPLSAPVLLVAGMIVSVVIGFIVTSRHLNAWPKPRRITGVEKRSGAAIAAAPVITQSGNWLILLAITTVMNATDAGVFRIAVLVCMLMELVNTSFATMAGPYLARAAKAGETGQFRKTIMIAGTVGLVIASPVGLIALAVPEWVLGLFGPEFTSGALALQFLAVGQLFNVLAGPVGIALIMQNRERTVLQVEGLATVLGLALAVWLLPAWGVAGAGLGLLVASLIRNSLNWSFVWFARPQPETVSS